MATDIVVRGIDIIKLPHVVNFDLPSVAGNYVHRISRAEVEDDAMSLVCADKRKMIMYIDKFTKCDLPSRVFAGFEPDHASKPNP